MKSIEYIDPLHHGVGSVMHEFDQRQTNEEDDIVGVEWYKKVA